MFEKRIKTIIDKICPNSLNDYDFALLNNDKWFKTYQINTEEILNYFLSVAIFESNYLTKKEENLNYKTEDRLRAIFPRYFKNTKYNPKDYINNPMKLANLVYGNKYGNKNPNDGYNFRGRGLFNHTFFDNYKEIYENLYKIDKSVPDFTKNPELINDVNVILPAACYFWKSRNLTECITPDYKKLCKRVNGGYTDLNNRINLLLKIKNIK